ncbi:MAG: response regulator [Aquabacterium sp.]|uniref:response regulator n=1 Tax=Aquabacterium sp. TaxID=1872578 RepID=UPI0012156BF2|nr:response regulator [Aquabacterium sp.]TAK93841.1 MAG: response regulator [Aquabacterium sp.]
MSKLMIVDDEANVTNALLRVLRRRLPLNVRMEAFVDPLKALARARESTFEIILSDYRMPQMDGITFLQAAKAIQPHAVCMILSASTEVDTIMKAINDVEAFRYLTKPWDEADLVDQIEQALHRSEREREMRHLADDMRLLRGDLSPQVHEARLLEELEPGITQVAWGPNGEVLMPPLDQG